MIKNSAYIRKFTPEHKRLLEAIAAEHKIKNANDVLLFVLEQHYSLKNERDRFIRFNDMKTKKIEALNKQVHANNQQCDRSE